MWGRKSTNFLQTDEVNNFIICNVSFVLQAKDEIKELQGRIKQLEEELDTTGEKLHETEVKNEEATKAQSNVSINKHKQNITRLRQWTKQTTNK